MRFVLSYARNFSESITVRNTARGTVNPGLLVLSLRLHPPNLDERLERLAVNPQRHPLQCRGAPHRRVNQSLANGQRLFLTRLWTSTFRLQPLNLTPLPAHHPSAMNRIKTPAPFTPVVQYIHYLMRLTFRLVPVRRASLILHLTLP